MKTLKLTDEEFDLLWLELEYIPVETDMNEDGVEYTTKRGLRERKLLKEIEHKMRKAYADWEAKQKP